MFSNSWSMRSLSLHSFKMRKQSYLSEVVLRKPPHGVYSGNSSPCSSSAALCGALRSFSSTSHSRASASSVSSPSPSLNMYGAATADDAIYHLDRSYQMIPKKLTIGKKIAVRSYMDRNRTELSERIYRPQKTWFMPYGIETKFSREKKRMTATHYASSQTLQRLPVEPLRDRPFCYRHHQLYNMETKLVWKAFDTPELIGIFLHDTSIHLQTCSRSSTTHTKDTTPHGGDGEEKTAFPPPRSGATGQEGRCTPFSYQFDVYSEYFLKKAFHYTMESRYWRCLGITKPFFDAHTLRAHCWDDNGLQVGTLVFSQAMRHALMDLERAVRRRELGLEPNYVWDRWGPSGFVDGGRMDYLPRFRHNPYRDPDGVEVTEQDITPYNTHRAIKERYGEFIFPDMEAFIGVFSAPTQGGLSTLEDIPSAEAVALFKRLQPDAPSALTELGKEGLREEKDGPFFLSPLDLRILLYLSAAYTVTAAAAAASTPMASSLVLDIAKKWLSSTSAATCWEDVRDQMRPVLEEHEEKVNAARLLQNTRHHPDRVRAFFEEKCGFADFMNTPDKVITGAVLAYLEELRRLCVETTWGAPLARALTDVEKARVMGDGAFLVYRHIEDAVIDKKRKAWTARFSGEANEEHTLDYLLENFGRRVGSSSSGASTSSANVGTTGEEFDREQEPIGRQVQRRVLDSDKANKLAEVRKSRGRMWSKKKSVFDSLHQKQLQNFNYGVR